MGRRRSQFGDSVGNMVSLTKQYFDQLYELAISRFEWLGMPETIDPRFLEVTLFKNGSALFFEDEILGYLGLPYASKGRWNVYNVPSRREAYASNSYHRDLSAADSVIIYNNYSRTPGIPVLKNFARRLANLDMSMDVNVDAQKTPILISCDETERLTMENLYKQYIGNTPVIMGSRALRADSVKVLKTDAPFVADKLFNLRMMIWNDALAYLGIPNVPYQKRERLVSTEVEQSQGGTLANRYGALEARRDACKLINDMFGLDIDCRYRVDITAYTETRKPGKEAAGEQVYDDG